MDRHIFDIDHCFYRLSTVMDLFQSQVYRINVFFNSILGLWPYQKFKKWQLFQKFMCQVSVLTTMLTQGIKLFEIWGDIDIMIECVTPMGIQLFSTIKALNASINGKKMKILLENMQRDWADLRDDKEKEIFLKYTKQGNHVSIIYAELLLAGLVGYLLIPLLPRFLDVIVPLNESRGAGVYLYHTQYFVDPEKYFIWICIHTYVGTIIEVLTFVAVDTMFVSYVTHVCAVLAVIGHRIRNLTRNRSITDASVNEMSKDYDYKCYQEIVSCVDHHQQIMEAIKIIESAYSTSFLLVLGIAMVLISMSMVQLLIKQGQIDETIRLLQFNFAQFQHLFFNTWPCQKLIDESINFREAVYDSEWYSLSEANKHLLKFAMLRTLEPQKIVLGGLYTMSMETFGVVVKSSISYFTVFASIR